MFTAAVADPNILILNDLVFICPENDPLSGSSSQSQQHSNWNQMLQKGNLWPFILMTQASMATALHPGALRRLLQKHKPLPRAEVPSAMWTAVPGEWPSTAHTTETREKPLQ